MCGPQRVRAARRTPGVYRLGQRSAARPERAATPSRRADVAAADTTCHAKARVSGDRGDPAARRRHGNQRRPGSRTVCSGMARLSGVPSSTEVPLRYKKGGPGLPTRVRRQARQASPQGPGCASRSVHSLAQQRCDSASNLRRHRETHRRCDHLHRQLCAVHP
ncbi:hypothetical protein HZS92_03567 [Xanthomonas citri pv. citri]|nr:Hypothetical Protein XCAW_04030 [Xanthomonas citri subsp. citri Aw12879]QYF36873.1 hypothetical protein HZS91_03626 [Xanthomonas citri pv. citri]QYF41444.1 hypothetical protein HZS92_03567 [Xanthomonas citri pv. citri]QYF46262.1 hypothetical protein HZS93_03606 [Xanthomonas citri]